MTLLTSLAAMNIVAIPSVAVVPTKTGWRRSGTLLPTSASEIFGPPRTDNDAVVIGYLALRSSRQGASHLDHKTCHDLVVVTSTLQFTSLIVQNIIRR
jgi:hypothetical protein